ncbi:hypothetical protein ABB55_07995 [Prosthecomicrobium hirschii]|uniref:5-formyltetrahydrofolate cyclo-ligase n=1 Tax=Prosthecodimorpha hirschii TaxID=665126 RepID=A0A0N8GEQ5_9HYPH|nr:5-formyltetrahydrofolate cyclo-ligase [Prosthecomicrobium hirschii]KPL52177.1 hypothetical protein ABB55_07995 [Prosthecomicrobium hirschii]
MSDAAPASKADLRAAALARRAAVPAEARAAAADRVAALVETLDLPAGALVSGFLPIRGEIDAQPAMARLAARGHRLCLPVILDDRTTMIFRAWTPGDPLEPARFGLSVPPETAPVVDPAVMLVPLAAFDRRGFRIGYGKGHYDRAIARIAAAGPLLEIGIAFACQEIERVPDEPHDRPMRVVLTEAGRIDCGADR